MKKMYTILDAHQPDWQESASAASLDAGQPTILPLKKQMVMWLDAHQTQKT